MARHADHGGWRGALRRGGLAFVSALCLGALSVLGSCGGGGSGVDSGGTGGPVFASGAVGPVSGFGSIIVAGTHYDETQASITDDDGQALGADALRLGVMTRIEGGAVDTSTGTPRARADTIRVSEQLVGPVSSVDATACAVVVLGQRVAVTPATAVDASVPAGSLSCRLSAVRVGALLGVYGTWDSALSRLVATRVDQRSAVTRYVLQAPVDSFDAAARVLRLGGQTVSLAELATLPTDLVVGQPARVKLRTAQQAGQWVATATPAAAVSLPSVARMELQGRITQFSSASRFSVDGVAVDASAASFPQGTAGLALGARVEIEGRPSGASLVATLVKVEAEDEQADAVVEIEGQITAIDRAAQTFVVRGTVIGYADSPSYEGGTAATLALQRKVSVKGHLSDDGLRVIADSIHIED